MLECVPLRTEWFGYRKVDVENCIGHLNALSAAELRQARESQRELEGIMSQIRQENSALRRELSRQTAAQTVAHVSVRDAQEQVEQLKRKLAASQAELRRYQTKLFACERQMLALRKENAELETACEQAHEETQQALARAERAEQGKEAPATVVAVETLPPSELPVKKREKPRVVAFCPTAPLREPEVRQEQHMDETQTPPKAAEPEWKPTTELEKLSVELLRQFDALMAQ